PWMADVRAPMDGSSVSGKTLPASRLSRSSSLALSNDPQSRLARQLRHHDAGPSMLQLVDATIQRLRDHRLVPDHLHARPRRALAFQHEALHRLDAGIARDVDIAPEAHFRIDVDVAAIVLLEDARGGLQRSAYRTERHVVTRQVEQALGLVAHR